MSGRERPYYIDSPTLEESTSRFPHTEPRFYSIVIRRHGVPGWVFRFISIDSRGAHEALANLNWGLRVAA